LVLRDLRMSKNCWACSVVRAYTDGWRAVLLVGKRELAHFEAGEEAICMATMALTILMNCWALLNVRIFSDD